MTTAALDAVLGKLHTAGLPKWHQYVKPGYPVQIAAPQKHIIEVLVAVRGGYEVDSPGLPAVWLPSRCSWFNEASLLSTPTDQVSAGTQPKLTSSSRS